MAPLTDDALPSAPQSPPLQPRSFDLPNPATQPPVAAHVPPPVAAAPAAQFPPVQHRTGSNTQPVAVPAGAHRPLPAASRSPGSDRYWPAPARRSRHSWACRRCARRQPCSAAVGPPHEASSFASGFALERHDRASAVGQRPARLGRVRARVSGAADRTRSSASSPRSPAPASRGYATSVAKAAHRDRRGAHHRVGRRARGGDEDQQ